jgi:hypothetical protein
MENERKLYIKKGIRKQNYTQDREKETKIIYKKGKRK